MPTDVYPVHRVFGRNYVPDGVSRPFSTLEQQRGQTLQRISALKASLSSIVSSHMHRLDSQNNRCASRAPEKFRNAVELSTRCVTSWSEANGNGASLQQTEDCSGMEPMTHVATTSYPIAPSGALSQHLSKPAAADRRGGHWLSRAHRQIETLIHEKHELERTCLDYEEHINELKQRCVVSSGVIVTTTTGDQLEENGVLVHPPAPSSSSLSPLEIQETDARLCEPSDMRETSRGVLPKTISLSIIEPLLRLLHRLSIFYPELLLGMSSPSGTAGTLTTPLSDWLDEGANNQCDEIDDDIPNHLAVHDLKEEEVSQMLKCLENILPRLMSSSRMMGLLTSAGASLMDWVKTLEDEVEVHRAKVLDIAEKLQTANDAVKAQMVEKEASMKAIEKREESLREVVDLIHAEFVKQQACIEAQNEHIKELSDELRQLAQYRASEAEELVAIRQQATQEVEALKAQIERLESASKADEAEHTHQMERIRCQLEETESRLASAEEERTGFMKELEALHQEQLIAEEHNQNGDFLGPHSGEEKMNDTVMPEAPCADQSAVLDLQKLIDISALVNAEREERQLMELDEQRGVNVLYCDLLMNLENNLKAAQQVILDVESHADALTKQLWERGMEYQSDTSPPVCREVANFDETPPDSNVRLMTSTMMLNLSQMQAQIKSIEEKATSLQVLLGDVEGIPFEAQAALDECASLDVHAPTVDNEEKYDHDDPSILSKELLRTQQCLTSLGLQIDLLHDSLKRNIALSDAQTNLPCEACIIEGQQDYLPHLSPPAELGNVELPPRLPPISVEWLDLDPVVSGEGSSVDKDAAMATHPTPSPPPFWWNLDEVIAALTQHPRPDRDPSQLEASEDSLYCVGLNLLQALGLAPPGTPSFALWDRFLLQLQNAYRAQRQSSPLYCSDEQAANALRLFGALVFQSGVLARGGVTFGEKWIAVVAGLCQLLGRTADYEEETNLRDVSLCRWGIVKQLIQHVESCVCHSQSQHEGNPLLFAPPSEDSDPIAMVYHLLRDDSVEFQQGFMISCGAQLKAAETNELSGVDSISTVSLLQLFLMLSQEVGFFDHSAAVNSSLTTCDWILERNDESQTVVSPLRRLLSHLDGHLLPLSLLISRILSYPSSCCLVQTLLAIRSRLLDRLLDEKKESRSFSSTDHFTANSTAMETFVKHILSTEAHIHKNAMPPSITSNEVSEQEILQLYKDNLVYREHLEALLCSIESKKSGNSRNGLD